MPNKKCFIIMPITTPQELFSRYNNDQDHFFHVMTCLFIPAIKKARFEPILPRTQGSDFIHADIISKIESSDLVLCDMSILNPNVFFELGIRTALNKPVCLIKDEFLQDVPFDTNILNYHTYSADLSNWKIKPEIENLANHIKISFNKNNDCNPLWKYFSLKLIVTMQEKTNEDSRMEYLIMQVDALRKQLDRDKSSSTSRKLIRGTSDAYIQDVTFNDILSYIIDPLQQMFPLYGMKFENWNLQIDNQDGTPHLIIKYSKPRVTEVDLGNLCQFIKYWTKFYGMVIEMKKLDPQSSID
jgi:hypothetical protein